MLSTYQRVCRDSRSTAPLYLFSQSKRKSERACPPMHHRLLGTGKPSNLVKEIGPVVHRALWPPCFSASFGWCLTEQWVPLSHLTLCLNDKIVPTGALKAA